MNTTFPILCSVLMIMHVSSLRLTEEGNPENTAPATPHHDTKLSGDLSSQQETSQAELIFFAGVEGSGHHLMSAITKHLKSVTILGLEHGWGCGETWKETSFQHFVAKWKALQPGIYLLPEAYSYPMCGVGNHNGRTHSFYPHIDWMHAAAEEAGAKLHIIYLYRPLTDCLAADCLHRKFEPCANQTEVLVENTRELLRQLQRIPRSDCSCFPYGDVNAMQSAVTECFGPESKELVDVVFADSPPQGLRDSEEKWSDFEAKLQPIDLDYKAACSSYCTPIPLSKIADRSGLQSLVA